jgi:hypothetical protein
MHEQVPCTLHPDFPTQCDAGDREEFEAKSIAKLMGSDSINFPLDQ